MIKRGKGALMLKLILVLTLIGSSFPSLAKSDRDSLRASYVRDYPEYFYIKPILSSRLLSLDLKNNVEGDYTVMYEPNASVYLGFGAYIFGLGAEFALELPNKDPDDIEKFGETDVFDLQANIYTKKFGLDLVYQKYQGFYIENPYEYNSNWSEGNKFPQRPDLKFSNTFINGFWVFNNRKFSIRSPYSHADRQLRSSGSFLLFSSLSNIDIEADSSLIPAEIKEEFNTASGFRNGEFTTFAVMPGYSHNFIMNKFYINASLSLGPGHQWVDYQLDDALMEENKIQFITNLRAAVGYNSDRFFSGFSFVFNNVPARIENMEINGISGNFKLVVGYRFTEFGILKKDIPKMLKLKG